MKSVFLIFLSAGLFAQSKPVASVSCTTKACQSFNELARGHDSAVLQADMACFYDGDNPANAESESNRTTDEFFLTMGGKKAVMRRGEHPGMFVSVVMNGQPEDYQGYGPKHGGLEDSDSIKAGSLFDGGDAGMAATISHGPTAPYTEPRRIHVDGEVQARSLVYRVTPEIPHEAQVANVSGTVVLHAVITGDGRARELQYVSGTPLLAQAVIDAVTWWRYWVTGEPVEVDTTIQVVFPPVNN